MPVGHGRRRHPGKVFTRPTHGGYKDKLFGGQEVPSEGAGALGGIERSGAPMAEARSGEQTQVADLGPQVVQTGHFDYEAAAPQVNNSPADPTVATVYVDPTGLHVLDGAIFLTDYAGVSVLSSAGFDGAWADFIADGVYNGSFGSGALGAENPTVTEPTTAAEYAANLLLSTDIPYWQLILADSPMMATPTNSGTSGYTLALAMYNLTDIAGLGTKSITVMQDVPVAASGTYRIRMDTESFVVLGLGTPATDYGVTITASIKYYDADHSLLSNPAISATDVLDTATGTGMFGHIDLDFTLPASLGSYVSYVRLYITASAYVTGGNNTTQPRALIKNVSISRAQDYASLDIGPWTILGSSGFHSLGHNATNQTLDVDTGNGFVVKTPDSQPATAAPSMKINAGANEIALQLSGGFWVLDDGRMYWDFSGGSTADFNLNAEGTNTLTLTDANLQVHRAAAGNFAFGSEVDGDSVVRFVVKTDGTHEWGAGSGARDASLYRTAAGELTIDNDLVVSDVLTAARLIAAQAVDSHSSSDAGTNYPVGLSWFIITSGAASGWPLTDGRGTVVTFSNGGTVIHQVWFARGSVSPGTGMATRNWDNGGSAWRAWQTLA